MLAAVVKYRSVAQSTLRLRTPPVVSAVILGVLVGAAIILCSGGNPLRVYGEIVKGALSSDNLPATFNWAAPLLGMALAAAIPLRGGIVNLGGDGQLVVGGLAATMVAIYAPLPPVALPIAAVLGAMAAGAIYAGVAAWGQNRFGVPLLVSSLLLSYIAVGVTSYLVSFPLADAAAGIAETRLVPSGARLPMMFSSVTSGGILIALVLAGVIWIDRRMAVGYELRLRGATPAFAKYIGVHADRQTLLAMASGGAAAGLVGAVLTLGMQFRFIDGALTGPGYSWSGLMAALLARGSPVGTAVGAIFFAALQSGGFAMQRETDIPRVLTMIIQAVIILFLAIRSTKAGGRAHG